MLRIARHFARGIWIASALASVSAYATALTNWQFESPALGSTNFQYHPTAPGWTFGPGTGLTGKQSGFTSGNPLSDPSNGQVAFIQNFGVMSQSFTLGAGQYSVTFSIAKRVNYQNGTQIIAVSIDGVEQYRIEPLVGDMRSVAVPVTVVGSGTHTLSFTGVGSGTDFTAFIDDVTIAGASTILSTFDVGNGCGIANAHFIPTSTHVGEYFDAAVDGGRLPGIAARFYKSPANSGQPYIMENNSWYNAQPNTLVANTGCNKGPYASPTPGGDPAQSTFQLVGTEGGFLMLWDDATLRTYNGQQFFNPNVAYSKVFPTSTAPAPWQTPGDLIEFSADFRVTMVNRVASLPTGKPVVQYFFAMNIIDPTGRVLPWSFLAYDSRSDSELGAGTCDQIGPDDGNGNGAYVGATISNVVKSTQAGCPQKWVRLARVSETEQTGSSGPGNGAWQDYRKFVIRVSYEDLNAALVQAGRTQYAPNQYKVQEVAIVHEAIWDNNGDKVDTASSFRNFTVSRLYNN